MQASLLPDLASVVTSSHVYVVFLPARPKVHAACVAPPRRARASTEHASHRLEVITVDSKGFSVQKRSWRHLQKASIIEAERGTATSGRTNLTSGVAFFATSDGDDDDDEAMKRVMNASGRGWVNEEEERKL